MEGSRIFAKPSLPMLSPRRFSKTVRICSPPFLPPSTAWAKASSNWRVSCRSRWTMPPLPSTAGPPSCSSSFSRPAMPSPMPAEIVGSALLIAPTRCSLSLADRKLVPTFLSEA